MAKLTLFTSNVNMVQGIKDTLQHCILSTVDTTLDNHEDDYLRTNSSDGLLNFKRIKYTGTEAIAQISNSPQTDDALNFNVIGGKTIRNILFTSTTAGFIDIRAKIVVNESFANNNAFYIDTLEINFKGV